MIVNKSFTSLPGNFSAITRMQGQMNALLTQLASGKRHNTLAEMGSDRMVDLGLRARLARVEGYQAGILTVETRLGFHNNVLSRLDQIEADARALATPGGYGTEGLNLANAQQQAAHLLREVIDLLNTDITGQYIFGGNRSDTKPVSGYDAIMNGAGGKDGFLKLVQERKAADAGDGLGRLSLAGSGATVEVAEDGAHPFGFKLQSVFSSNPAVSVDRTVDASDPDHPRSTISVVFDPGDPPQAGDTITIGVSFPDDRGRTEFITLTATTEDPAPAGSFLVTGDVAAQFREALEGTLEELAETKLASSSVYTAADDFFSGQPRRVPGGVDPATATTLISDDRTLAWYHGQDDAHPRQTVSAAIDESTRVHYGVQANEYGFVELIKGLAVFAAESFTPLEPVSAARYEEMVALQRERLSESNNAREGSIEGIVMQLGLAGHTLETVKQRHTQYDAQLKTMLAGIEEAPLEEVIMQMLTLQTRMQASYQVTAMVNQLTLVNFLR